MALLQELQGRLTTAIKSKDEPTKSILRVVLGEVSTLKARTGKDPEDGEVQKIIKKLILSNNETILHMKKEDNRHNQLVEEIDYLNKLLPETLAVEQIVPLLREIETDLKNAKNDGQATGMAVKFLKSKGITNITGEDVAAAAKQLR